MSLRRRGVLTVRAHQFFRVGGLSPGCERDACRCALAHYSAPDAISGILTCLLGKNSF
jgi:hypothetical protein